MHDCLVDSYVSEVHAKLFRISNQFVWSRIIPFRRFSAKMVTRPVADSQEACIGCSIGCVSTDGMYNPEGMRYVSVVLYSGKFSNVKFSNNR